MHQDRQIDQIHGRAGQKRTAAEKKFLTTITLWGYDGGTMKMIRGKEDEKRKRETNPK